MSWAHASTICQGQRVISCCDFLDVRRDCIGLHLSIGPLKTQSVLELVKANFIYLGYLCVVGFFGNLWLLSGLKQSSPVLSI